MRFHIDLLETKKEREIYTGIQIAREREIDRQRERERERERER